MGLRRSLDRRCRHRCWWHGRPANEKPSPQTSDAACVKASKDATTQDDPQVKSILTGTLLRSTCVDGQAANLKGRAVDLVPRQSALNVNAMHDERVLWDVSGTFQSLLGFGAKTRYQRQRERFEQFVHQDIFASGFGRGTPEFGWTFGPLPGQRHVSSGSKVTCVALIAPRSSVALTLQRFGCDVPRKNTRPVAWKDARDVCAKSGSLVRTVDLKIPGELEGFNVREIRYQTAAAGEVVTVALVGEYFSPQVGVLVNGMPLRRPIGVAQVKLNGGRIDGLIGDQPVGELEFLNQQHLVLRFRMENGFEGTPRIALVTPQRVGDLGLEELRFLGTTPCAQQPCRLIDDTAPPMFSAPLTIAEVLMTGVEKSGAFSAHLSGTGLADCAITLNGVDCPVQSKSSTHLTVQCKAQDDRRWVFQSTHGRRTATLVKENPYS